VVGLEETSHTATSSRLQRDCYLVDVDAFDCHCAPAFSLYRFPTFYRRSSLA
jgi:hypothetical protein